MEEEEIPKMITITLNYDLVRKTGTWGVMSADAQTVNLLDVAEALSWAVFDTVNRLKQAQIPIEEDNENKEG